ncbi:hypothetical protein ACH54D_20655 [Atlantibacter hermannii]|uniref:hypothetical protein n=1 Tax=Atlantibacter hermannii TaxID=565 RepID=UPI0032454078
MAKSISINGHVFKTIKAAGEYFSAIRLKLSDAKTPITTGETFDTLDWVYREYCRVTAYTMPGEPVEYFAAPVAATSDGSRYGTTIAFHVGFADGTNQDFSIKKALTCIADHQNTGVMHPGVRS